MTRDDYNELTDFSFRYRLHGGHASDDLDLLVHPAPNVEPGDVVVLADGKGGARHGSRRGQAGSCRSACRGRPRAFGSLIALEALVAFKDLRQVPLLAWVVCDFPPGPVAGRESNPPQERSDWIGLMDAGE